MQAAADKATWHYPEVPDIRRILDGNADMQRLARDYGFRRNPTDLGNAERFADRFAAVTRYDHTLRMWRYWDGKRWAVDETGVIQHLAGIVVRAIYSEASAAEEPSDRKALASWAKQSENRQRLLAMVELAQSLPELSTTATAFDRDPDILNVRNGVIHLPTATITEHKPAAMLSKLAPVDFRPELMERDGGGVPRYASESRYFAPFIAQTATGRADWATYLQRSLGYAITGHAREQVIFFWVGAGGNGKSVLEALLRAVAGDYWQTAPPSLLIDDKSRGAGASPELARLPGVRVLAISETDDSDVLREGLVKTLTGGDRIAARPLYGSFFEFVPQFVPILSTNHKPRVRTGGHSMWRRIRVVPFDYRPDRPDPELPDKLATEHENVLAWLIDGARRWYAGGFPESEAIDGATATYRTEEDSLRPFLQDCTVTTGTVHRSVLYKAYRAYCDDEGTPAMGTRRFNAALRDNGFTEIRDRVYANLSLLEGRR
jgi:putative DNA primase/helicase